MENRIPFVLDACEETFRLLDQLLDEVWHGGLDGKSRDMVARWLKPEF